MDPHAALAIRIGDLVPMLAVSRGSITVVGILVVVVLVLLSAFFASAEIAIFSLADARIGALVEEGTPAAATLSTLKSNPRRLLVTILVGNNVANIGMSSIVTGLLGLYLSPGESVLIATFGVTSLVLLLGETAPKSYAVEHSEGWSLRIARPLRAVQVVLYPLVEVFDRLTKAVNRLLGSEGDFESAYVTWADVRETISAGRRSGVFADEEYRMLQRVLRFRNRTVKEAMVPRRDVIGLEADATLATAIDTCLDEDITQLPVYDDVLDRVVGIVHVLDLLEAHRDDPTGSLESVSVEPYVVPETKDVDELLTELRADRREMAIVVDEFGTTAGIVTIEDIVEEIIGEVLTETETPPIRWLDDDAALLRGELNLHAANEALGTDLPEGGDFETVAGLLMSRAGRVLGEGESVTEGDVRLTVETAARNRILEVRIDLPQPRPNGD